MEFKKSFRYSGKFLFTKGVEVRSSQFYLPNSCGLRGVYFMLRSFIFYGSKNVFFFLFQVLKNVPLYKMRYFVLSFGISASLLQSER